MGLAERVGVCWAVSVCGLAGLRAVDEALAGLTPDPATLARAVDAARALIQDLQG